ncbi:MAG: hypothetical protein NXH82_04605 [Rhodobacteraceae bacterium]|nr:hypothetical protein [Paracoccaceae bacterium]
MDNKSGSITCAAGCWLVALLGGVLAFALLMVLGGWTFLQAVFAGSVLAGIAGLIISRIMCTPLPAPGAASVTAAPRPAPAPKPAQAPAAPAAEAPAAPASEAAADGDAPKVTPSAALPGQAELAARKGTWTYASDAAPAPAAVSASVETVPADAADAVAEAEPTLLNAARDGKPDDLKLIKGVGPKLESTLNELGFYHFDQIANWTEAEIAWVDTRLKFKGRILRDGWQDQARILAEGGETEFSKRNG